MKLGKMLPDPPTTKGQLWTNTDKELSVYLEGVSDDEYTEYVDECEKIGYTIDADDDSGKYEAYNKEGYRVSVSIISDQMAVQVDVPEEFSAIKWPNSKLGKLLPVPKSLQGSFLYEEDSAFSVHIGDTSPSDYAEYVQKVSDAGFNVDYDKGDKYYYADNKAGYSVSVEYRGFNIMSIMIDSPSDDKDGSSDNSSSKSTPKPKSNSESISNDTKKDKKNKNKDSSGMRSNFKKAMDSYESFFDEYIKFMKKYNEDSTDAELAYYLKVQTRVSKKIVKASITEP